MLRSEEVNKFILYIPVTSSTQIIEIIGNHKLIHFYPTGRNDHFSKEQRELEKQRNKLKFILTEYHTFNGLKEQNEPSIFFDLDDVYGKLTRLKEIQESTSKSIQKISEDLFTLKESSSFNEFYLVGTLENEKCFLFEKVLYEVLKRNVIFKSQDIPSVEKISFGSDVNNLALENDTLKEKDTFFTKEMKKEQFLLPTKSNRRSYQILLHSEETFLKISKIFQSLGGKIVNKEKILNKHKNILHCSTLLAQLKKIYINNEINMKYLLSRNILKVNELKIKNERELKIYNFLSDCFFNKNSFVALCFVPKRYLYKFKKIVEYVNQEYSLAIEERNVLVNKNEENTFKENEIKKSETNLKKSNILKIGKEENIFKDLSKELSKEEIKERNDEEIKELSKEEINKDEMNNEMNNVNKEETNNEMNNEINKKEENISKSFLANEEEFIPPSFFHTGKFTQIYQELTNTFEVPKYGELNPGIFSVFFFPFFFGMMFSDTLHGLILLFLGIFLIYSKKVNNYFKESELLKIVENAKYLLISMGIYSIYFGLLFCDFGGVELKYNFTKISYFGVKHMADQKEFINKLKMKMSIILGAMHMLAGIILGFVNKSDNLISLISITVSYLCFVGYLVFLIFYKWVCEVNVSLINELVEMYTKPFDKKNLFSYQKEIQLILIITLILSMLVLFLNKPVRDVKNVDLWVEQSIHSIEYGVSLVSNTASYLRLWAVSLAHGTLTEILHANTFGRSFLVGIIALPLYLMMTFGLLIGLEGTSATLHALRLNWIEFSGKFMRGGGVEYKAFSFDEECD